MEEVLKTRKSEYGKYLRDLLSRYKRVEESELDRKTVRLNSRVELWIETLQKQVKFRIVLPVEADLKKRNLSVFAPVCLAVLGHREGEQVQSLKAGMKKVYRIVKVENRLTAGQ